MFCAAYKKLTEQCEKFDVRIIRDYSDLLEVCKNRQKGAIFTVENASVLAGKIENISLFKDFGVKFVTLTWNGRNELGAGSEVSHSNGITKFGIDVIQELENNNIIIDVSHASDRLFYDIIRYSSKPLIATHSNSRTITDVKRNITDGQFKLIADRRGLVGLNFHRFFLNNDENKASMYDVIRHAEHFLSLGGENILALGADFDGCSLPKDINGIDSISILYELFLRENYNEDLVKKIFFENALNFCQNFDKH